jgi:cobyrinic acid a,c-diamide synthase
MRNAPRLVVAGLAGDSGKTLVSMAILHRLRKEGLAARAFKKGPDYIDTAWLSWATGQPARNLDSWLMGFDRAAQSFQRHSLLDGFNLIEGNRGLFDGVDSAGTHSTAELSKVIQAPVLLVINVAKMTRTAGALVLGCQKLDPDLNIAGVIVNRVHGSRHEAVVRAAIESASGLPVLGAIPALTKDALPGRHLGLVTPSDNKTISDLLGVLDDVAASIDMRQLLELAHAAPPLNGLVPVSPQPPLFNPPPRIAILRDAAFNFYYPENIEALTAAGAELVFVSSLEEKELPHDIDAIYIGGGFPEVHAIELAANKVFLQSLAGAADRKMPIYAECGGLMLLARSIGWENHQYPMSAILPVNIEVSARPQGHGYVEMTVTHSNAFYPLNTVLRGHEFHYSHIVPAQTMSSTACAVSRGTGVFNKRDGLIRDNIWASYTHLHATSSPEWAEALVRAAQKFKCRGAIPTPVSRQIKDAW